MILTIASGTVAPDSSVTIPCIELVNWAMALDIQKQESATISKLFFKLIGDLVGEVSVKPQLKRRSAFWLHQSIIAVGLRKRGPCHVTVTTRDIFF